MGEDEHGAAEPAAEEARAESTRLERHLDEKVELRDRDLVVVAEARVALAEEHAGRGEIAGLEGGGEPANTFVLGDDVPQPPSRDVVQSDERSGVDVGGTGRADDLQGVLELAAPLGVGGVLEAPRDAGADDQERGVAWNVDQPVLERVAVEEDRTFAGSEQARGLVEDAARDAHRPQLGPLAEEGEFERIELEAGDRAQRERDRHFEGGGRREPRSRREVGRDRAPHSDRGSTSVGELGGHRLHVARPSLYSRAAPVGGDGLSAPVALGQEHDLALGGGGREPDAVLDRDGQDEPAAVVGVLADEVDPPRRPDTVRRRVHVGRGPGHWSENLARSATPDPRGVPQRRDVPWGVFSVP